MGRNLIEKILSSKCGRPVSAGDIVVAEVDFVMGQDGTTPLAINAFRDMHGTALFDPSRVALVIDHSAPSPTEGVSNLHKLMRDFAGETGCHLYDVGEGVCHQLMLESGVI
ncbi:MAG: 3-isopropylmalate dehydratase large subunit, partial [Candidatus Desulforudis sp.]|nr:3-isopropylmalate dehydratase large subunit [Desulforudis sp.]